MTAHRRQGLSAVSPDELAAIFVRGLRVEGSVGIGKGRRFFDLDPLPNFFFQRDPQVVVGEHVVISAMATSAREREPFLSKLAFDHHPALSEAKEVFQIESPSFWAPEFELEYPYPRLEGGDVLIANEEVLLIRSFRAYEFSRGDPGRRISPGPENIVSPFTDGSASR